LGWTVRYAEYDERSHALRLAAGKSGMMRRVRQGKRRGTWQLRLLGLLLLATILPTLSFMGHWDEIAGAAPDQQPPVSQLIDLADQQAERIEHTQHCHVDLSSCAAQPLPSGMGLLITRDTLLTPPPLRYERNLSTVASALYDLSIVPTTPPPRGIA
jgi:hypothetical protein